MVKGVEMTRKNEILKLINQLNCRRLGLSVNEAFVLVKDNGLRSPIEIANEINETIAEIDYM